MYPQSTFDEHSWLLPNTLWQSSSRPRRTVNCWNHWRKTRQSVLDIISHSVHMLLVAGRLMRSIPQTPDTQTQISHTYLWIR